MAQVFVVFLSLLLTPVCVFISTSVSLYLGNQKDLFSQYDLLIQFVFAALVLLVVGIFLYFLSSRTKYLLWSFYFYYFLGPAFLIYGSFHVRYPNILDFQGVIFVFLITLMILSVILALKVKLQSLSVFFALVAVAFIINDGCALFFKGRAETAASEFNVFANSESSNGSQQNQFANIYHIIVDGYQTEMFLSVLDKQMEKELSGFRLFSNARGTYTWTVTAIASLFLGYHVTEGQDLVTYHNKAYSSEESLLNSLSKKGYKLYDILPYKCFEKFSKQEIVYGETKSAAPREYRWKLFRNLWIIAYLPSSVATFFVTANEQHTITTLNSFPIDMVIRAKSYFQYATDIEKMLSDRGRYSFYHFTIPHPPYILKSDCSFAVTPEGNVKSTTPKEQSRCASLMIRSFLAQLKKLGRYDNSLIIIQADHGNSYLMENGKLKKVKAKINSLEYSDARSRPLFMVKFPSNGDIRLPFRHTDTPVSLLDVSPTICEIANLSCNHKMEGISLLHENKIKESARSRYYFYFDKEGKGELKNKLYKYRIDPRGVLTEESFINVGTN